MTLEDDVSKKKARRKADTCALDVGQSGKPPPLTT